MTTTRFEELILHAKSFAVKYGTCGVYVQGVAFYPVSEEIKKLFFTDDVESAFRTFEEWWKSAEYNSEVELYAVHEDHGVELMKRNYREPYMIRHPNG